MHSHRCQCATKWTARPLLLVLVMMLIISMVSTEVVEEHRFLRSLGQENEATEEHVAEDKQYKTMTVGADGGKVYCLNNGTQRAGDQCNESNEYVVLRKRTQIFTIPDIETLEALMGFKIDPNNVSWIPELDPALLTAPGTEQVQEPLPSLKKYADNPDELETDLDWFDLTSCRCCVWTLLFGTRLTYCCFFSRLPHPTAIRHPSTRRDAIDIVHPPTHHPPSPTHLGSCA